MIKTPSTKDTMLMYRIMVSNQKQFFKSDLVMFTLAVKY